jgi:hypothetical protein
MTLDQCVQRLRKRITEESELSRERVINNVLKQVGKSGSKLDRTPSFYTSRSIVNLSGLSVADPTPLPKRKPSHGSLTVPSTPANAAVPGAHIAENRSASVPSLHPSGSQTTTSYAQHHNHGHSGPPQTNNQRLRSRSNSMSHEEALNAALAANASAAASTSVDNTNVTPPSISTATLPPYPFPHPHHATKPKTPASHHPFQQHQTTLSNVFEKVGNGSDSELSNKVGGDDDLNKPIKLEKAPSFLNERQRRRSSSFNYFQDLSEEESDGQTNPQVVTYEVIEQMPLDGTRHSFTAENALPGNLENSGSSSDSLKDEKVMHK